MSDSYKDVESRITKALKAIHDDPTSNILQYSRDFCVPYHRLYHRHQGRDSRSTRSAKYRKLIEVQEEAILDCMTRMDELFMSLTLSLIRAIAKLKPESTPLKQLILLTTFYQPSIFSQESIYLRTGFQTIIQMTILLLMILIIQMKFLILNILRKDPY